jgi:hypothetical protein
MKGDEAASGLAASPLRAKDELGPDLMWAGSRPPQSDLSYRLERLVAFIERLVYMGYGLDTMTMEFFWGSFELMLGFLEMADGRLDPGMLLGRGGRRSGVDRHRGHSRMRRRGLGAKS